MQHSYPKCFLTVLKVQCVLSLCDPIQVLICDPLAGCILQILLLCALLLLLAE